MDVETFKSRLESLQGEAVERLQDAETEDAIIKVKNAFLGRNGEVQELMSVLRELPDEDKPEAGRAANGTKSAIQEAYEERIERLEAERLERRIAEEAVDVTLPAREVPTRNAHPVTTIQQELTDTFVDMGYEVAEGPEIEEDFYNFEALNFPKDHPARDMQDTFKMKDGRLLRTHTSPVQIRTMLAYEPPVRIVAPGRVFRCDADVTHNPVFHQIEGLLVDRDVTFADLKGTLHHFVDRTFGSDTPIRFRPSFFPFTEPSAEVDIGCIFCGGDGCRVCGDSGWLEILGAGMVDPNVFRAADVDPDVYTGFAFGLGVERIAMLKYEIDDIRLLYENDVRFLRQF